MQQSNYRDYNRPITEIIIGSVKFKKSSKICLIAMQSAKNKG